MSESSLCLSINTHRCRGSVWLEVATVSNDLILYSTLIYKYWRGTPHRSDVPSSSTDQLHAAAAAAWRWIEKRAPPTQSNTWCWLQVDEKYHLNDLVRTWCGYHPTVSVRGISHMILRLSARLNAHFNARLNEHLYIIYLCGMLDLNQEQTI